MTEQGVAEVTTTTRCERIVPVQDADADLFRKTSKVVTRVIQVRPFSVAYVQRCEKITIKNLRRPQKSNAKITAFNTQGDNDVISFRIYARWCLQCVDAVG